MKEVLIAFIFALVVGSAINGSNYNSPAAMKALDQSEKLATVDSSSFSSEVLEADKPVLVDFYTDSCVHCKNMVPVLAQISSEYKNSLKMVKVDAESNPTLSSKYQITALPGFVIFKKGAPVESFAGEMEKSELETLLGKYGLTADNAGKAQES